MSVGGRLESLLYRPYMYTVHHFRWRPCCSSSSRTCLAPWVEELYDSEPREYSFVNYTCCWVCFQLALSLTCRHWMISILGNWLQKIPCQILWMCCRSLRLRLDSTSFVPDLQKEFLCVDSTYLSAVITLLDSTWPNVIWRDLIETILIR